MDKDEVSSSQEFITVNPIETLEGDDDSTSISLQLVKRLKDARYHSLESVVVLGAQQISNDIRVGLDSSQRICGLASMKLIDSARTKSANQIPPIFHIETGSKTLDHYLGGGIEVGAVTEFFGKSASGKTQLCHTISVTSQVSPRLVYSLRNIDDGKCSKVIYIDTEGAFYPHRIYQIARARGLKSENIVENIIPINCYSVLEQEQYLKYICELLDTYRSISLIIVDSIISHFRTEYPGRSVLPERQQRLNKYLSTLSRIARIYKVAVVITNQMQSIPSGYNEDNSSGGNILSHNSTHRVRLNKSGFGNVYATIIKSPYHASNVPDAKFIITNKGIDDLDLELGHIVR